MHIGSFDGFVSGGILCFESENITQYHHDEINGKIFYGWFAASQSGTVDDRRNGRSVWILSFENQFASVWYERIEL